MDSLIDTIYSEITTYITKPFTIFGHSMGGVIGYALTKKLEKERKYIPQNLIISASKPPKYYAQENRHKLSNKELKKILIEHNATPKEVLYSDELMDIILPIYRDDLKLLENYNPSTKPKLDTPIIIFNNPQDIPKEIILEWSNYFNSSIKYFEFGDGHFFINSEKKQVISKILTNIINKN